MAPAVRLSSEQPDGVMVDCVASPGTRSEIGGITTPLVQRERYFAHPRGPLTLTKPATVLTVTGPEGADSR